MTKHEIDESFDKQINYSKKAIRWVTIIGGSLFLTGVLIFFLIPNYDDKIFISYILMGISSLILFLNAPFYYNLKKQEKKITEIRTILVEDLKRLVWAYIFIRTIKGVKARYVYLKFKNGLDFLIYEGHFKKYSPDDLLDSLKSLYNENIILGYSEEIQKKYTNNEL